MSVIERKTRHQRTFERVSVGSKPYSLLATNSCGTRNSCSTLRQKNVDLGDRFDKFYISRYCTRSLLYKLFRVPLLSNHCPDFLKLNLNLIEDRDHSQNFAFVQKI